VQDVLGLGAEHRMNVPGTAVGNWRWRVKASALTAEVARKMGRMTHLFGRA
jgi:4-alpha-glucanotransferase